MKYVSKTLIILSVALSVALPNGAYAAKERLKMSAPVSRRCVLLIGAVGLGVALATGGYFLVPDSKPDISIVEEIHNNANSQLYKTSLQEQAARGEIFLALEGSFFDPETGGMITNANKYPSLQTIDLSNRSRLFGIENEFAHSITGVRFLAVHTIDINEGVKKNNPEFEWLTTAGHLSKAFPTKEIIAKNAQGEFLEKYKKQMRKWGLEADDIQRVFVTIQEVTEGKSKITEPLRLAGATPNDIKLLEQASEEAARRARELFKDEKFRSASILIGQALVDQVVILSSDPEMQARYSIPTGLKDYLISGKNRDRFAIEWRDEFVIRNLKLIYEQAKKEGKPVYIIFGRNHGSDLEKRIGETFGNSITVNRIDSAKKK